MGPLEALNGVLTKFYRLPRAPCCHGGANPTPTQTFQEGIGLGHLPSVSGLETPCFQEFFFFGRDSNTVIKYLHHNKNAKYKVVVLHHITEGCGDIIQMCSGQLLHMHLQADGDLKIAHSIKRKKKKERKTLW